MMRNNEARLKLHSMLGLLLFASAGIGAKGCDHAVVGDDGQCTENCAGEANSDTGGSSNATGGSAGSAGKPSTSTGGSTGTTGGSGNATGGSGNPTGGKGGTGSAVGGSGNMPGTGGAAAGAPSSTGGSGGQPPHGATCGGLRGSMCATGQFCDFAPAANCGRADATGTCEAIPEACDAIYAPVCGCDGMTYSSGCAANMHGVSVESDGECGGTDNSCGGLLGKQCAAGSFCNFPPDAQCGAADQTGVCEPIPDACTQDDVPVCGCDGMTYSNACIAHTAGVSVAADGACQTDPPDFCGGIAGVTCPKDMYCDFPLASHCGDGDMTGTCRTPPDGCITQVDPVCGCDGKTYSNGCEAARAGVSVSATGACK